jgi:L-ascorbate metabolism protein UlaG (beta-lactamase superfamily)
MDKTNEDEKRRGIMKTLIAVLILISTAALANAQTRETPVSTCLAVAENRLSAPIQYASLDTVWPAALQPNEVQIRYIAHSTFLIEDATGIRIATDFSGFAGSGVIPDVVTMNHAHTTHFTRFPDPKIKHVLRGWGRDSKKARHKLQVGEVLIRNVTTDINSSFSGYEKDGNSIFIFEMGGLCIGHLGHLHHVLSDAHYAEIGRLDILMVPVDGGWTMALEDMAKVVRRLNASVVLPMHAFGEFTLQRFLDNMGEGFPIERKNSSTAVYTLNTLPASPRLVVLEPETSFVIE